MILRRCHTAVVVVLCFLLLSACGRKTALVPPQKLVPVRITDLGYVLDANGVTLNWSYPTKMENGDALHAIEGFELLRAVMPEADYCQGCPVEFEEPVEIEGGPLPSTGEGRTASYRDEFLQSGFRYLYEVRSQSGWRYASAASNMVSFVWLVPPQIPRAVSVEPGDRMNILRWEPVTENIRGEQLGQAPYYQVFRRKGETDFVALGEPVRETGFKDEGLVNGTPYFYKVEALLVYKDTSQAGGYSPVVSGVPLDKMPPGQVRNLVAVAISGGIKLVWQRVESTDLAGYRIYRRVQGDAVPELIAQTAPDQNEYVDRSVAGGRKLFYTVTAFDAADPVNESRPGPAAEVELR